MKIRDLTGCTFNMLTAKQFDHKGRNGLSFYEFECECGNKKVLCGTDVSQGKTKSCGCFHHKWPLPQTLPIGQAAAHMLYSTYKYDAIHNRSLAFELSEEEFLRMTKLSCAYCGVFPEKECRGTSKNSSPYLYNGIDRVDNTKGYITTNVCPCCAICNRAKHAMPLDKFLRWIERLVEFQFRERDATSVGEN
jgi:hypothetical protein